jgi:pyochelin synthetase
VTIAALIGRLEGRGILLSLAGEEIRYRSPAGALTDADRQLLRAQRTQIVDYLKSRAAARALRVAAPIAGPLTPSVAHEMWRQFAGGPREGEPVALNIPMMGSFRHAAPRVSAAMREIIARYDALRTGFVAGDGGLRAFLNPAENFVVEQQDLDGMAPDAARAAAQKLAQQFCAQVNRIEGGWLTRAKVFAVTENESLAAISSAHMIADAGTRNILLDELRDILDHGAPRSAPSVAYNDYALAERRMLDSAEGAVLIDHWRRWYHAQPSMKAPSDGTVLQWGNGIRIVKNFTMPKRVLDKVRLLAESLKVTPFLIFLTIFARTMARWSGMEGFPLRVLGDKRTTLDLSNTVGLMFCADAMSVHAPADADFETVLRNIQLEYDAALALRIPTLHFWAPHCVKPGIEAPDYPNRIPAVFNYYSVGTAREKEDLRAGADTTASLPWPPDIVTLSQDWPRRSSPLFLHVMDWAHEAQLSLHFYQGVVSPADQDSFTTTLFQVFAETVPD